MTWEVSWKSHSTQARTLSGRVAASNSWSLVIFSGLEVMLPGVLSCAGGLGWGGGLRPCGYSTAEGYAGDDWSVQAHRVHEVDQVVGVTVSERTFLCGGHAPTTPAALRGAGSDPAPVRCGLDGARGRRGARCQRDTLSGCTSSRVWRSTWGRAASLDIADPVLAEPLKG